MKIKQCLHESTDSLSLSAVFPLLDVSKSGYYEWLQKINVTKEKQHQDMKLRDELQRIALGFPRCGYRRMIVELQNRGYLVNL
jgi:hypothetical protein